MKQNFVTKFLSRHCTDSMTVKWFLVLSMRMIKKTKSKLSFSKKESTEMCKVVDMIDHFFNWWRKSNPSFYNIFLVFLILFWMDIFKAKNHTWLEGVGGERIPLWDGEDEEVTCGIIAITEKRSIHKCSYQTRPRFQQYILCQLRIRWYTVWLESHASF